MNFSIDILKNDERFGKLDQILDLLFCISSVIFAFAIPFQIKFTPWIAHWFSAVLIFKAYYLLRGKEKLISIDLKNSIAILSLGLFGLWSIASTHWSLEPEHTYRMAITWLAALLIIPNIYIFSCKRAPITLMLKAYTLGCTALIFYIFNDLTENALNGNVCYYMNPRQTIMNHIASISYHHIYLGFIISISIFISLNFLFDKGTKKFEKTYYIIHLVSALLLLTIDNSRIIFIALFINTLIFALSRIRKNWKIIFSIIGLFALIVVIFSILPTRTSETISRIISSGEVNDPRFFIWKALIPGIKDVPFLGYGYQATTSIYTGLYRNAGCWFAENFHYISHNQFIESYYNLGIVGLILSVLIPIGFCLIVKTDKSIISIGTLVLLIISMIFDVPFFHCLVAPLVISWLAFCYSGKKDMEVKIPSQFYLITSIVAVGISIVISINLYNCMKKYSTHQEVEISNFSQRKYTKKSLKEHKIKDENVFLIFAGLKGEMIDEHPDNITDKRYIAHTRCCDSLVCNFDYYISEEYEANSIEIYIEGTKNSKSLDLNNKNQWVSDSLIILPPVSYISTTDSLTSIYYKYEIDKALVLSAITSRNSANTGYAIFRNITFDKPKHQN